MATRRCAASRCSGRASAPGAAITVRMQNTSDVPNTGAGTTVAKTTFMSGQFVAVTMFGSFNGVDGTIASIQGFQDAGGFVPSAACWQASVIASALRSVPASADSAASRRRCDRSSRSPSRRR